MSLEVEREDWTERAACIGVDQVLFFPDALRDDKKRRATAMAIHICNGCEVRAECLEYALRNDENYGIWGGKTEPQRRLIRRPARNVDPPRFGNTGTSAGYQAHRRRDEPACADCLHAARVARQLTRPSRAGLRRVSA